MQFLFFSAIFKPIYFASFQLKPYSYNTFMISQIFLIPTELSRLLHNPRYFLYTFCASKTRKPQFAFLWNLYLESIISIH